MTVSSRRRRAPIGLALLTLLATGAAVAVPATPASADASLATCAQVIAIAVRGTVESPGYNSGPFGNTYASGGLGTLAATVNQMQSTSSWKIRRAGLDYPAAWDNTVSTATGILNLKRELNQLAIYCPGSRTVLLGYSQGAAVIGEVLGLGRNSLTTQAQDNIKAVIFFGDPGYRMGEIQNAPESTSTGQGIRYRVPRVLDWLYPRLRSYCFDGDWACDAPSAGPVHDDAYDRSEVTNAATQFILNRLSGGSSTSGGGDTTPIPAQSEGLTVQEIAQAGGYTGPLDGVPGTNTWLGAQQVMAGYGYTGPIDGVPGANTYAALQRLAQKGGYTGPVDGALGVNSWKGLQTVLRGFGYAGPIDGLPGTNTYAALQRLAKLGGYTGPIDGALGGNSWKGVQKVTAGYGYTGPIDGVPGVNTYAAMQRMAALGGYTGPIDGIPGPNTWAALARLI
ncbi:cutinase family protein [Catellatospora sichuanensis]|uniref:cutinase family protein n=1 Tax=Catellatospora sichuanensis TaxID=1969805 RepID=UPI001181D364|nr:cutinase family protein [Catellatospora sichuanensis]